MHGIHTHTHTPCMLVLLSIPYSVYVCVFSTCLCLCMHKVCTTNATLHHRLSPPHTQGDEIPIEDYPPRTTHSQQHSVQYCKISNCAQQMRLRYTTSRRSSTMHAKVHTIVALHHRLSPPCTQDDDSNLYILSIVTDRPSA